MPRKTKRKRGGAFLKKVKKFFGHVKDTFGRVKKCYDDEEISYLHAKNEACKKYRFSRKFIPECRRAARIIRNDLDVSCQSLAELEKEKCIPPVLMRHKKNCKNRGLCEKLNQELSCHKKKELLVAIHAIIENKLVDLNIDLSSVNIGQLVDEFLGYFYIFPDQDNYLQMSTSDKESNTKTYITEQERQEIEQYTKNILNLKKIEEEEKAAKEAAATNIQSRYREYLTRKNKKRTKRSTQRKRPKDKASISKNALLLAALVRHPWTGVDAPHHRTFQTNALENLNRVKPHELVSELPDWFNLGNKNGFSQQKQWFQLGKQKGFSPAPKWQDLGNLEIGSNATPEQHPQGFSFRQGPTIPRKNAPPIFMSVNEESKPHQGWVGFDFLQKEPTKTGFSIDLNNPSPQPGIEIRTGPPRVRTTHEPPLV